jgi:hypothetical protein
LNVLLSLANTAVDGSVDAPFSVYPNPASGILHADKALHGGEVFALSTMDGRIVKSGFFNGYVAVGDVPPGLYFFRLNDGANTWTFMVIVAR